jgi:hypothetical protein
MSGDGTRRYGPVMSSASPLFVTRRLASVLEPVVGQVYFSPEGHAAYAALGFQPSQREANGVALPDGVAYFTSRGSVMGQVPGQVVAAAFGVFNPAAVVPAVTYGWTLTDAATICAARDEGAIAQLRRILGEEPPGLHRAVQLLLEAVDDLRPEGKPLFAGVSSLHLPEIPLGVAWRLGDRLREYRGDVHINAWTDAGFDAVEMGLLTELYWGLRPRTYIRTRAWSNADLDAATERLSSRGLLDATGALTDQGWADREDIEARTDRACRPVVDALGDTIEELIAILGPWGEAIRAAGGYLRSGPHDLAESAARR